MGHDSSVYLIYGVPFDYNKNTGDSLDWLLKLVVPDIIDRCNGDMEDVWSDFDYEPHTNGYFLLNFTDQVDGESQLFVACYFHSHVSSRGADNILEVKLPSDEKRLEFETWCENNNILQKPKFYTKLYESY